MSGAVRLLTVTGPGLAPWLNRLAELRIRVFRDFPYLYDGDPGYEADYLSTYLDTDSSVCVLALDGDRLVGASTGLPLSHETEAFRRPFVEQGLNTDRIFYCAESVLLPEYRGQGLYKAFFNGREAHARHLGGFELAAFCAVVRPAEHPLRPDGYRSLEPAWHHFGYQAAPGLLAHFGWKDIDQPNETDKPMQFYLKPLEAPL
ncbi:GNAT family N-acetyltransferase [uncultured Oceanisphaera sp.]|uniref:GNAT family N-acetyltransferase n=1 Tax=uncultured Oceanisphaera sp. TaxID=353858 RepID=UPI00262A84B9|nr:GNAT family N-acetyltransferase [uncultured Oceanisphaera sp.]